MDTIVEVTVLREPLYDERVSAGQSQFYRVLRTRRIEQNISARIITSGFDMVAHVAKQNERADRRVYLPLRWSR